MKLQVLRNSSLVAVQTENGIHLLTGCPQVMLSFNNVCACEHENIYENIYV